MCLGTFYFSMDNAQPEDITIYDFMKGVTYCYLGYIGFEVPITIRKESINPDKDIPAAMLDSIVI